jgi:hypothetical protein
MIRKGFTYTASNTCLCMYIMKVHYISDKHVSFKGVLSHKKYGYLYETKNYKLSTNVIKRWKLHED